MAGAKRKRENFGKNKTTRQKNQGGQNFANKRASFIRSIIGAAPALRKTSERMSEGLSGANSAKRTAIKKLFGFGFSSFFILIALCSSAHWTLAQNVATDDENLIQDIRMKCRAISSIQSSREVQMDATDKSAEGGVIIGYFDGNELKKIVEKLYGETTRQTEKYYFWEGGLIFVLSQTEYYEYPINDDHEPVGEVDRVVEEWHYFKGNKMIRWVRADSEFVSKDNPEYSRREKETVEEANELMTKLRREG